MSSKVLLQVYHCKNLHEMRVYRSQKSLLFLCMTEEANVPCNTNWIGEWLFILYAYNLPEYENAINTLYTSALHQTTE